MLCIADSMQHGRVERVGGGGIGVLWWRGRLEQGENDRIQNKTEQVHQVTQEQRHCAGIAAGKGVTKTYEETLKMKNCSCLWLFF